MIFSLSECPRHIRDMRPESGQEVPQRLRISGCGGGTRLRSPGAKFLFRGELHSVWRRLVRVAAEIGSIPDRSRRRANQACAMRDARLLSQSLASVAA